MRIARALATTILVVATGLVVAAAPAASRPRPVSDGAHVDADRAAAAPADASLRRGVAPPGIAVTRLRVAVPPVANPRIRLESGFTLDPALGEPAIDARLRESAPGSVKPAKRSFIVYFADADADSTRRAIEAGGGLVVAYVPDHAFLIRLDARRELSFAAPGAWVGAFHPAYKLSPRIAGDTAGELSVLVFPDGDAARVGAAARAAGADVLEDAGAAGRRVLRVRGGRAAAEALARDPDVEWVEPRVRAETFNDLVQGIVQTGTTNNRRLWDLGLHGEGQVIMTSDTGLNTNHFAFRDPAVPITGFGSFPGHRKVIAYLQGAPFASIEFGDHGEFHGTHTAGTVAGNDDALSTSPRDGVAKEAKLWFTDLSGAAQGRGIVSPPDLNDLFAPSYAGNAGGAARISSNSWGAAVNGAYTIDSYMLDEFVWSHPDYLAFFAAGNSTLAGTMGSPATAKNCVSVGATGNGFPQENALASYSSRGPTQDGRIKPTVLAPGGVSGGVSVYSATTDSATYAPLFGTSMACPAAAGAAALMRQYLTEGWYPTGTRVAGNAFAPSAALMRAMCINSAVHQIPNSAPPDMNVGWGRICADSALYLAGDARRLLLMDQTQGLLTGDAIEFQVNVVNTSMPLKVSLCWTDYPGHPAAALQLVNDLDLRVSKGALVYRGNVFANAASVTGGSRDSLNVEEGVRVLVPTTGVWTVRVEAHDVPAGPQAFGLAVTGGIDGGAGSMSLDRATYGAAGTVHLHVTDADAVSPISVSIASTSEPGGESVTLTGVNNRFDGSILLSPVAGTVGDGVLRVSHGDVITATYVDASTATPIVSTARVEIEAPVITSVLAAGAGSGAAWITWTTSADADSRVYYGPTAALGSATPRDPVTTMQHGMLLTGLTIGQTYWFDVESLDPVGNVTRDDRGGAHYKFSVDPRSDLLLVYDGVEFERSDRYATALAATGWPCDVWSRELSEAPMLGSTASGLRSYKAVWWQNGVEHYPPFTDAARDSIGAYLAGGGRMAVVGHDVAWANMDPASPYYTSARSNWMGNALHTAFLDDPVSWSGVTGVAADPISGAYTGGASYTPFRAGAAGDEVASLPASGTSNTDWRSGDASPDACGFRWESTTAMGVPGIGVWGGAHTKLATMYFEWAAMDPTNDPSPIREDVLQKTIVWLVGRDKPHATVTAPNGGEVLSASTTTVTWTESTAGGTGVANRRLEYSLDGGQSWSTISASAGPSPFVWDVSGLPNTVLGLVRARITDNGSPSLSTVDRSDAVFSIVHAGGDAAGPVVTAGSVRPSPDPIDNQQPCVLSATVTDLTTGGGTVTAAEWSLGVTAKPAGTGTPMSGSFGAVSVDVTASLPTQSFVPGIRTLWVRGRDAAGNWGTAQSRSVVINGVSPAAAPERPLAYELAAAVPNPAFGRARVRYALPARGVLRLNVYDVHGRRVRILASGAAEVGLHDADWDLRDDGGHLVRAGVYYYRLDVAGRVFTRRLVVLE